MRLLPILFMTVSILALSACEATHVTAAKSICACFDVANYKIGKGHNEGEQTYERCRSELQGHLKRYESDKEKRLGFLTALKACPNATVVAPTP